MEGWDYQIICVNLLNNLFYYNLLREVYTKFMTISAFPEMPQYVF